MSILQDFKKFIMRGNVIDMAVGIIIGASFTSIVQSIVNDIIMPPIGMLTGKVDFKDKVFILEDAVAAVGDQKEIPAVAIKYGSFINNLIVFLIVAAVTFMLVRMVNKLTAGKPEAPAAPSAPTDKECPQCMMRIPIKATRCGHCTSQL